jgi:hypothetical protein
MLLRYDLLKDLMLAVSSVVNAVGKSALKLLRHGLLNALRNYGICVSGRILDGMGLTARTLSSVMGLACLSVIDPDEVPRG